MKQIFLKGGNIITDDIPIPAVRDEGVLVRVGYSLISSGTESATIRTSTAGIISEVREQPQLLKRAKNKVLSEGIRQTTSQIIKMAREKAERRHDLRPLGYSGAGTVVERGAKVKDINIGDKVAYAGSRHAEVVYVPRNLLVRVPDAVELSEAAFVALGSIAMQGIRRARVEFGETIAVIGLGLVGQLVSQILHVAGARVVGTDLMHERVELAKKLGIERGIVVGKENPIQSVLEYTGGIGADAVIICASTESHNPVKQALEMARDKARVIVIGDVGMNVSRSPFYEKELDFLISRSYGPGRYDKEYEQRGIDYPIGYVRWTENRNMEEFLKMIAEKKLTVKPLTNREVPIEDAQKAYDLVTNNRNDVIGVLLKYPVPEQEKAHLFPGRLIVTGDKRTAEKEKINVAVIGCGTFAKRFHLPNLQKIEGYRIKAVADPKGDNAKQVAQKFGAEYCTTDYREILADDDVDLVMITTRHNLHAPMAIEAIKAGKNIFVEKPMAMTYKECDEIAEVVTNNGALFTVGFNRRFAPLTLKAKGLLRSRHGPMMITYRVNAGKLSPKSWVYDPIEGGGRIIGEVCHFFDLLYWLTQCEPIRVFAGKAISNDYSVVDEDNVIITIWFADGSIASIAYTSLGEPSFPKERIEIFAGDSVLVIDDLKELTLRGFKEKRWNLKKVDKGHHTELKELLKALRGEIATPVTLRDGARATFCCLKTLDALRTQTPQVITYI